MAQLSTAISDFVLALASLYCACKTNGHPYQSCYGLATIGVAASLGVLRFGSNYPRGQLIDAHKLLSWLGSVIGMPFLAAGILRHNNHRELVMAFTLVPVGFLFLYKALPKDARAYGNSMIAIFSVISILISSLLTKNFHGVYSAIAIILSAVAVGTDGRLYGILCVDIFHYLLAIANIFYTSAIGVPMGL